MKHTHTHHFTLLCTIHHKLVTGSFADVDEKGSLIVLIRSCFKTIAGPLCISIHASSLPALLLTGLLTVITPFLLALFLPIKLYLPLSSYSSFLVPPSLLSPFLNIFITSCTFLSVLQKIGGVGEEQAVVRLYPPWQCLCSPHHCICAVALAVLQITLSVWFNLYRVIKNKRYLRMKFNLAHFSEMDYLPKPVRCGQATHATSGRLKQTAPYKWYWSQIYSQHSLGMASPPLPQGTCRICHIWLEFDTLFLHVL